MSSPDGPVVFVCMSYADGCVQRQSRGAVRQQPKLWLLLRGACLVDVQGQSATLLACRVMWVWLYCVGHPPVKAVSI